MHTDIKISRIADEVFGLIQIRYACKVGNSQINVQGLFDTGEVIGRNCEARCSDKNAKPKMV